MRGVFPNWTNLPRPPLVVGAVSPRLFTRMTSGAVSLVTTPILGVLPKVMAFPLPPLVVGGVRPLFCLLIISGGVGRVVTPTLGGRPNSLDLPLGSFWSSLFLLMTLKGAARLGSGVPALPIFLLLPLGTP